MSQSQVLKVKRPYTKPALNLRQQMALLQSRGMSVSDEALALKALGHINYHRLTSYWLPFEADHSSHRFKPGTQFEGVKQLYEFDRELRLLVMDAIERVEVAMRAQFGHRLAVQHGPHVLVDPSLFNQKSPHWQHAYALEHMKKEVNQSKELFIRHWRRRYNNPLPPIWVCVELMTLGQLSKWFANLKTSVDRNRIAREFGFDEVNLVSFMHHLTIVRNLCAHHSRLWNREFTFTFKLPRHRPSKLVNILNPQSPRYIYNTLAMLACLLDGMNEGTRWKKQVAHLICVHQPPVQAMGFPLAWSTHPFWSD